MACPMQQQQHQRQRQNSATGRFKPPRMRALDPSIYLYVHPSEPILGPRRAHMGPALKGPWGPTRAWPTRARGGVFVASGGVLGRRRSVPGGCCFCHQQLCLVYLILRRCFFILGVAATLIEKLCSKGPPQISCKGFLK